MLSILPLLTLERAGTEVQMTPLLNYTRAVLALSCLKHKQSALWIISALLSKVKVMEVSGV